VCAQSVSADPDRVGGESEWQEAIIVVGLGRQWIAKEVASGHSAPLTAKNKRIPLKEKAGRKDPMNANFDVNPLSTTKRLRRILQEPITFIILVWSLMLTLVGLCFAFTD